MNTFTDDDLKRLKEILEASTPRVVYPCDLHCAIEDYLPSLLARLEAAERICNIGGGAIAPSKWAEYQNAMTAWQKAAGK